MIFHSYLTEGFTKMGCVFLESLHYVHGKNAPFIWLDTRGCSEKQTDSLKKCYPQEKIYINSMPLPMEEWAKKAGLSVNLMEQYKIECEQVYINPDNKVWKLMTSGDDRWRSVYNVLFSGRYKYMAHFDIDTLFRFPIIAVINDLMKKADIWLKLRLNHGVIKARITTDGVFVRPNDSIRYFFDRWRYHIDRIAPIERPVGWGQGSCWYAFEECKDKMSYACMPLEFGLPSRNGQSNYIWNGNVHLLKKADCVEMYKNELNKWKSG